MRNYAELDTAIAAWPDGEPFPMSEDEARLLLRHGRPVRPGSPTVDDIVKWLKERDEGHRTFLRGRCIWIELI